MLRIFANSLFTYSLYTHAIALIFIMWDYFYVFMCVGDVPSYGAFDRAIKSQLFIVT